jgi:O-antigen ligase
VFGLGLCGFRAAILAAGLGLVMAGICLRRMVKLLGFVAVATIPVCFVTMLVPSLFHTVVGRFATMATDNGSDRLIIWRGALKSFWDHPFVGFGLDNFKVITGGFYSSEMMPHSIYIGTLVELGMIGSVLLLLWSYVLLRKAWRAEDRIWVFPVLVAYLFQAMFLHEFYYPCFWLGIALVEGVNMTVTRPVGTRGRGRAMERAVVRRPMAMREAD